MELKLPNGMITLIDDEDAERISHLHWYAARMTERTTDRYWRVIATVPGTQRKVFLHRLLLAAPEHLYVDHINGNTLDNRKANLRLCTNAENQQNSGPRGGSSRFKGVSWVARRARWRVAFNWQGETHFVGYFDDEEVAARAYDTAIFSLAGEFARLNFPNSDSVRLAVEKPGKGAKIGKSLERPATARFGHNFRTDKGLVARKARD